VEFNAENAESAENAEKDSTIVPENRKAVLCVLSVKRSGRACGCPVNWG
jgi:hypothetical protein